METVAPTPAPTMTPPQVVTQPPMAAANGTVTATPPTTSSSGSGSFQDAFKKAVSNPVQLGFGILTTTALFYGIYYFSYNIRFSKTFVKRVENKMDELDMKYADLVSKVNSNSNQATPQDDLNLNLW